MDHLSTDVWHIHLGMWIIQDGNYSDFRRGQAAEFALEFYSKDLQRSTASTKQAQYLGDSTYQVTAEVVFVAQNVWVIDFGVSAYREEVPPAGVTVGSFVSGQIIVGVDPFFYKDSLFRQQGMPPLIYSWRIDRIQRQTAPYIETTTRSGGKLFVRDPAQRGYTDLEQTDAWHDDGGRAEYVLSCNLLSHDPKRRATAV